MNFLPVTVESRSEAGGEAGKWELGKMSMGQLKSNSLPVYPTPPRPRRRQKGKSTQRQWPQKERVQTQQSTATSKEQGKGRHVVQSKQSNYLINNRPIRQKKLAWKQADKRFESAHMSHTQPASSPRPYSATASPKSLMPARPRLCLSLFLKYPHPSETERVRTTKDGMAYVRVCE